MFTKNSGWTFTERPIPPGTSVWGVEYGGSNFTQRCYGNSTLNYVGLPSYWNGHVAGGLLDKVPPNERNPSYFNGNKGQLSGSTPAGRPAAGIASPFLTAIVAVFGLNTFFNTVASNSNYYTDAERLLCAQLRYPFTSVSVRNNNGLGNYNVSRNQSQPLVTCPFPRLL